MDFTGFTLEDHYRAVVQERERQAEGSRWRRRLERARRATDAAGGRKAAPSLPQRTTGAPRPTTSG